MLKVRSIFDVDPEPLVFESDEMVKGYTGEPVMTVSEIFSRVARGQSVKGRYPSEDEQIFESELVDDFEAMDYKSEVITKIGKSKNRKSGDVLYSNIAGTEAPSGNSVADNVGNTETSPGFDSD